MNHLPTYLPDSREDSLDDGKRGEERGRYTQTEEPTIYYGNDTQAGADPVDRLSLSRPS